MLKFLSFILLVAIVNAQDSNEIFVETTTMPMMKSTTMVPMEETTIMPVEEPIEATTEEEELPCLNKAIGSTLPHPGDQHKFLRCVAYDTLWIELCPSNLVYNQWKEVCDWNTDKPTTAAPTTRRPFVKKPIFSLTGARMIKGRNWLKQLTSTWATPTKEMMTTEPTMEMTTPEVISSGMNAGKVVLPKDTLSKIKGMIKGVKTTVPVMTTPETATAFIEKDGMWFDKKEGESVMPVELETTTIVPMEKTTTMFPTTMKMKPTTPIRIPTETEKLIMDNVETGKKVVKPVVEMGKDAVKVLLSRDTIDKIQKLIKKTV